MKVVSEHYICDLCKQECKPVKTIRMHHNWASYDQEIVIVLDVRSLVPYDPSSNDVCEDCLHKALSRYLSEKGVTNE